MSEKSLARNIYNQTKSPNKSSLRDEFARHVNRGDVQQCAAMCDEVLVSAESSGESASPGNAQGDANITWK